MLQDGQLFDRFKHKLPDFAYERIRKLIEEAEELNESELYSAETGKHFASIRNWDGKPAYSKMS